MIVGSLPDDLEAHEGDHELRREGRILQIGVVCRDQGQKSATDDVVFADGTEKREALVYGRHARSQDDARPTILGKRSDGLTAYRMKLSETDAKVERIVFRALSTYAGLRVHAVTGF